MKIEIYKKNQVGDSWTMCEEVYSMVDLKEYYAENEKSGEVWELKYEIVER
jgi:hypothetical protein